MSRRDADTVVEVFATDCKEEKIFASVVVVALVTNVEFLTESTKELARQQYISEPGKIKPLFLQRATILSIVFSELFILNLP